MDDLKLNIVQEREIQRFLVENSNGSIYQVSELVYAILLQRQQSPADEDAKIAAHLNEYHKTEQFTAALIAEVVENVKTKMRSPNDSKRNSYLHWQYAFIKGNTLFPLYQFFSKLFANWLLIGLSFVSVTITTIFFSLVDMSSFVILFQNITAREAVLLYAIFMVIILLHEIGHASASYAFSIKPGEIGVGLYWLIPVLYTNVSAIWKLNARKRIIVNFAGIYIQLLVNLVLLPLYFLTGRPSFLFLLICMNSISTLISLNPFFRYDGYWMYSDGFDLPNLQKRAGQLIKTFFTKGNIPRHESPSLVLYAVGKMLFWAIFYYEMIKVALSHAGSMREFSNGGSVKNLFPILPFAWMLFFFLKPFWGIIKKKYHGPAHVCKPAK